MRKYLFQILTIQKGTLKRLVDSQILRVFYKEHKHKKQSKQENSLITLTVFYVYYPLLTCSLRQNME